MNLEKSQKMKNLPMGKLIASMSIPAMFSMLIQALYNIIDTIYVAQIDKVSDELITALGYAFPMQMLFLAFAIGIGIGTNVLVSRKLGEKKSDEASNIARTGVVLAVIMSIVFFILSFIVVEPFMRMMSSNERIIEAGVSYLKIVMMISIFMYIEIVLNKVLQAMGSMIIPMLSQLIGAITNIILDPIFIFGGLGIPAMGVSGAAIATVIGQAAAMLFTIIYIATRKFEINLGFKNFKIKLQYIKDITITGLPSTVMNSVASFTSILLNRIIRNHDPEEIGNAVLTAYFKLQSFVFMPVFGLNQGGMPILSYNYGSGDKKRFNHGFKLVLTTALIIMTVGFIIFQLFPGTLLGFFSPSEKMLELGVPALRIISLSFIPAAISIIITMSFQVIGRGATALMMSLLRQLLLLLPLALILGNLFGLNGVWTAYPISEVIVAIGFFPVIIYLINKVFKEKSILENLGEIEVLKEQTANQI